MQRYSHNVRESTLNVRNRTRYSVFRNTSEIALEIHVVTTLCTHSVVSDGGGEWVKVCVFVQYYVTAVCGHIIHIVCIRLYYIITYVNC